MSDRFRAQAIDSALATATRIASHPDVVAALDASGASVGALLAAAENALGASCRESTHRTERLASASRVIAGHVPVARTFGRHTEADEYELLDGAPVGTIDPIAVAHANRAWWLAVREQSEWDARNARADAGQHVTRKSLRNAKRAAARARKAGMP